MNLTELTTLSTALRDEVNSGSITATRLGNILLGIVDIFTTDEATLANKANQSDLSAEEADRANADSALQNNIDNEASARQEADTAEATARQEAIDSEAAAREEADNNRVLTTTYNSKVTDLEATDDDLLSDINTEVAERKAADLLKADAGKNVYELWSTVPQNNTTYELGEQKSLVLSTNAMDPDACVDGTLIFFSCPTDAATTIVYKDNTLWTGEDAPEVYAGCSYCIAIMNGAYSLQQLTDQSL